MAPRIEIFGHDHCRFTAAARCFCEKRNYPYIYFDLRVPQNVARLNQRKPDAESPAIFLGNRDIGGHYDLVKADAEGVIQSVIGGS
jgi:glutaredoxin